MKKVPKKLKKIKEKIEDKFYSIDEAVDFLIKNNYTKFDSTLELHLNLNLKKGKEKANFRILLSPPHPLSTIKKIAVLGKNIKTKSDKVINSKKDILEAIKKGKINFSILIVEKDFLKEISPYAKILGPKGLMPTEKNQTLVDNAEIALEKILKGQREIRPDADDLLHIPCGKISLGKEKILENINYIIQQIKNNRPQSIKGEFIKKIYLTSTIGPSLKIDLGLIK